jgi:hypothetical protein
MAFFSPISNRQEIIISIYLPNKSIEIKFLKKIDKFSSYLASSFICSINYLLDSNYYNPEPELKPRPFLFTISFYFLFKLSNFGVCFSFSFFEARVISYF